MIKKTVISIFLISQSMCAADVQSNELTQTNYFILLENIRLGIKHNDPNALKRLDELRKLDNAAECPGLVATDLLRSVMKNKGPCTERYTNRLLNAEAQPAKRLGIDVIKLAIHNNIGTATVPFYSTPEVTKTPEEETIPPFFNGIYYGNKIGCSTILDRYPEIVTQKPEGFVTPHTYLGMVYDIIEKKRKDPTINDATLEELDAIYNLMQQKRKVLEAKEGKEGHA